MIEPNRRIETLKPVEIASPQPDVFRIDMGRNYAGWFEIRMKGSPGQKVTLEFAERPNESVTYGQAGEYIFGTSGEGVFCHRFNHAVSRWVTIRGLKTALARRTSADTLSAPLARKSLASSARIR